MSREGIDFDYLGVDEGHNLLNREGKENSAMANVTDALSSHTPYYVNATADPVKNDASEVFSLLQKMDPDRYTDRDAFMRKYGIDTAASKDNLKRGSRGMPTRRALCRRCGPTGRRSRYR